MKVIVNDTAELIVEDAEGNVLCSWNPFENKITETLKVDKSVNSVIEAIQKSSRYV